MRSLAPQSMQPGTVFADRFTLERRAGAGGMGEVWRARDNKSGTTVALKLLRPDVSDAPRFVREAELLAAVRDDTIVGHVAHGVSADGQLYLAMEWIDGEDLSTSLSREPFTPTAALALVARIARALAVAHKAGVVHRDVKPNNVMLPSGRPEEARLVDFGIARLAGSEHRITRTGAIIGTPQYMAPEQIRGAKNLDPRVDVYALGCVLFEVLTGTPPFTADAPVAVLARVLLEEPPRLADHWPESPPALDALVAAMLAKDPRLRLSNGEAVLAALSALDAPGRATLPSRPQSLTARERRLVSVVAGALPADRSGDSTTLAKDTGPSRLKAIAARFDCELELLPEGSFFAAFSGGTAARDQVAQAARCALALLAESPQHRLVVATGRAVVEDRTPLGEVVDRAAAILMRDEPGVHVDGLTADLLDGRFALEPRPEGARLTRELDAGSSGDARPLLGRITPFVGRDRELGALEALYAEAAEESAGRVALVTAPPGLGKTRLRVELLKRVRDRDDEVAVWLARGDATRAGSPLGLLSNALAQQLRVAGHGEKEALEGLVATLVPPADRHRVTLFLAEQLGLMPEDANDPLLASARRDPVLMSAQTQLAFVELFLALARRGPLVLVLEDLHWGDARTVALVGELLKASRELPLFVLALARPEVHTRFPRLWAEHALQEVGLTELRPRAAERFVREMLGDPAPELVAKVVAAAAGNAFFLEELVRSVAKGSGDLPGSVVAMAQARLEALAPEERRVLRAASVLGEVFWSGAVAEVSGVAGAAASLKSLLGQELLVVRSTPRFEGEVEYAFRHAFLRDAAFAMLTDADRSAGHLAAARWLEQHGEREALVVARHFEQGGDAANACRLLVEAADQAMRAGDLAGAQAAIERGFALGATGETAEALAVTELELLRWSEHSQRFAERAPALLASARPGSITWCQALGQTARSLGMAGLAGKSSERLTELAKLPAKHRPEPGAEGHYAIGLARLIPQVSIHVTPPATELLERLLEVAGPLCKSDANLDAQVIEAEAFVRWRQHRPWLALQLVEKARQIFEAAGDVRYAMAAQINVLFAQGALGRYDLALEGAEQLIARGQNHPAAIRAVRAAHWITLLVRARSGNDDPETIRKLGDNLGLGLGGAAGHYSGVYVAIACFMRKDWPTLERTLQGLSGDSPFWDLRIMQALARLELGDAPMAVELMRKKPFHAEMFGAPELNRPHAALVFARALDAVGEKDEARRVLRQGLAELTAAAEDIPQGEWRTHWLEGIEVHQQLVALARHWMI